MENTSEHIRGIVSNLPEQPGVYQYFNKEGEIIYVGKAKNLKRRVSSYFNKEHDSLKTRQLVKNIADLKYIVVGTEQDAFLLENNLIKQYKPHYNILLKDGKSYPSICITREEFPRIFKTRKIVKGLGDYYGPYSYGNTVDLIIELIHKLYPLRTCRGAISEDGIRKNKYRLCLKYHIKHCCGVCAAMASKAEYDGYIDEARKIIEGNAEEISGKMMERMKELSSEYRYEEAARVKQQWEMVEKFRSQTIITNTHVRETDVFGYDETDTNVYLTILKIHRGCIVKGQTLEYKKQVEEEKEEMLAHGIVELQEQIGSTTKDIIVPFVPDGIGEEYQISTPTQGDRYKLLQLAMKNVRQFREDRQKQSDKLNPDQRAMRVLGALKRILGMEKMPEFIDSFDNSNLQGTNAVAACVVFRHGKASKKDYKRFIIKTVDGADDYASMREVVRRRYTRLRDEMEEMPDLILADGGEGQMHAIRDVVVGELGLDIPIAGLKKDNHHRTHTLLVGEPAHEISMKPTDEVFHLLTAIQDEVHRFAISFHKKKRGKAMVASELDDIKGVGEASKKQLLDRFGSIARLKEAKLDDIEKVIGKGRASIVYVHFHGEISG